MKNRIYVRPALAIASLLTGLALLSACKREPAVPGMYQAEKIGWTTQYPSDWKVLNKAEIAELEGKAREPMEEAAGGELGDTHQNLLYLRKNQFNVFTSAMQPFDDSDGVSYQQTQKELFDVILEAYRVAGIKAEHSTGEVTIDGLVFQTLEVKLFKPGTTEVLMTQLMYDRLFSNGFSLLFSINYNNADDQQTLQGIIDASKFTVRD